MRGIHARCSPLNQTPYPRSMAAKKPQTYRVENIPSNVTDKDLIDFFDPEDRPYLLVRSLVPAVESYGPGELTATIMFSPPNDKFLGPRVINDDISIDKDFYGFTPLNNPVGAIAAE